MRDRVSERFGVKNGTLTAFTQVVEWRRKWLINAHVAQSAEHFLGKEEVMGPIPIVGFAQIGYQAAQQDE